MPIPAHFLRHDPEISVEPAVARDLPKSNAKVGVPCGFAGQRAIFSIDLLTFIFLFSFDGSQCCFKGRHSMNIPNTY